jgi:hypothetical protein
VVERVEVHGEDHETHVVLRVTNISQNEVPFDPDLARLGTPVDPIGKPLSPDGEFALGAAGNLAIGAPGRGSSGSVAGAGAPSGHSWSSAGAGAGAVAGVALSGVVILPIALILWAASEAERPPRVFAVGQSAIVEYSVGQTHLDDGQPYVLVLDEAFHAPEGSVRVPLSSPEKPHSGYSAPAQTTFFGTRVGGGPVYFPHGQSAAGGVSIYGGYSFGQLGIGPVVTVLPIPAISAGLEATYRFPVAGGRINLDPMISYEAHYLWAGAAGFAQGPTVGMQATFPLSRGSYFGFAQDRLAMGLFAKGGPLWNVDFSLGASWQVGFVLR